MDFETLWAANAYTDSKGGYKDSYSMTYDGKLDGKVTIPLANGVYFVKVSDKVLTKEELIGASYVFSDETFVITEQDIIDNSVMGVTAQFYGVIGGVFGDDIPMMASCEACTINFNGSPVAVPSDGTYFLDALSFGSHAHVYSLSKETIVPIDPKYLPGVKEFNVADYGIDLMAIAMSGNQFTIEIPGLREKIGDSFDVVFVSPLEDKVFKARPSAVMYLERNGVSFQVKLDYVNATSKNVTQFVFQFTYADVYGDLLVIDCYTV